MLKRLVQLTAVLLAALWVPVTQHCVLEAAGVAFGESCVHDEDACAASCPDGGCESLAEISPKQPKGNALTLLPVVWIPALDLFALAAIAPPVSAPSPRPREMLAEDGRRQRTWVFARRSALPARAPDLLA